ncbi:MAG: hypothetical protein U0936_02835 [Planctomycetaceae bacterium]
MVGLIDCFTKAIPLLRGTFVGDIGFTLAFFSSMNLLPGILTNTDSSKLHPMSESSLDNRFLAQRSGGFNRLAVC